MRIHEIGEFGLIDRLADRLGPRDDSVVVGIGDDAAVLQYAQGMQVVTTTDLLVEGVHFRTDTIDDRSLGYKSVAVSFSDIAAMGGCPRHAVIGLAVPVAMEVERLEAIYEGVAAVCVEYGAHVVGGDVTKTDGPLVIAVTVLGEVEQGRALLRSGAQPGDIVYVTGTVGGSAAGLDFLHKGIADSTGLLPEQAEDLLRFHQLPRPQVAAGRLLMESGGCTSANDVSDGLASELNEIAKMSQVRLAVEAGTIPLHDSVRRYAQLRGIDPVEWALFGGEDYQLLGTMRADAAERMQAVFQEQGLRITVIGRVEAGDGVVLEQDGERREVTAKGFNHFD